MFDKSIKPGVANAPGFLQIASAPALLQDSVAAPGERAYNVLKAQVRKSHSVRLAALAVRIRSAKFGHFEPVIKAIDEMLVTLQEEGAADLAKKTQCLDEYQSITSKVKDLNWKIKNNKAEIEKLEELIALRQKEREETIKRSTRLRLTSPIFWQSERKKMRLTWQRRKMMKTRSLFWRKPRKP